MSNGTDSNTSGSDLAELSYIEKGNSDCISDKFFDELVRRLIVALTESGETRSYIRSVEEPSDLTALWQQIDASDNNVGQLKQYNFTTSTWEVVTDVDAIISEVQNSIVTPDVTTKVCDTGSVTSGNGTVTQSLSGFENVDPENIHVTITPFVPTNSTTASAGRVFQQNEPTSNQFRLFFSDIPVGEELTVRWMAVEC